MSLSHLAVLQQRRDGFHRAFTIGANPGAVWDNRQLTMAGFSPLWFHPRQWQSPELFPAARVYVDMKILLAGILASYAGLPVAQATAQQTGAVAVQAAAQGNSDEPARSAVNLSPVPLEWTPPALDELSREAAVKSSFTLDRNLLGAAASVLPDSDVQDRQTIRKLDGVSVHTMRFPETGIPDENAVESIRAAYHLRGWKHLVTTGRTGGPVHDEITDVWVVMDGVNLRGAVILAETPKSLTLVTVAGNLNPIDLLHLRGHFGIPRFDGTGVREMQQ